jgi:polyphosphate kinase
MKRNLESRVEVVTPVEAPALKRDLDNFLQVQLRDRRSAWEMQSDGSYGSSWTLKLVLISTGSPVAAL